MTKFIYMFLIGTLLLVGCTNNKVSKTEEDTDSKVLATTIWSDKLQLDWNYSIYLPSGYNKEVGGDYDIIYLLHGSHGNHRNLVERFPIQKQLDKLIKEGKMDKTVAVFVDGFNSFYLDGRGVKMESAIINDLIPTIEKEYKIKANRDTRFVGGISMGGYGAANLALKYPDLFSRAILLSPAVWYEMKEGIATYDWCLFRDSNNKFNHELWNKNHPSTALKNFNSDKKLNFYIITGEDDQVISYRDVKKFADELKSKANVELVVEPKGIHAWPFWEKSMEKALEAFK